MTDLVAGLLTFILTGLLFLILMIAVHGRALLDCWRSAAPQRGPQDSNTQSAAPSQAPGAPLRPRDQPQSSSLSISFRNYGKSRPVNVRATLNSSPTYNHINHTDPSRSPSIASDLHNPEETAQPQYRPQQLRLAPGQNHDQAGDCSDRSDLTVRIQERSNLSSFAVLGVHLRDQQDDPQDASAESDETLSSSSSSSSERSLRVLSPRPMSAASNNSYSSDTAVDATDAPAATATAADASMTKPIADVANRYDADESWLRAIEPDLFNGNSSQRGAGYETALLQAPVTRRSATSDDGDRCRSKHIL
jgi:hypothetical protein